MKKGLAYELKESVLRVSRHEDGVEGTPNIALALFWDALMVVLDDRKITESEMAYLTDLRGELEIGLEDVYMLHARAFAGALVAMIDSGECSETDRAELQDLHGCLTLLGWAPGSASLSPDEHTEEQ